MSLVPYFKLNTGALIPAIGSGTWGGLTQQDKDAVADWLLTAIKAGFRHLDTAILYGTEHSVGKAINCKDSGIPREEFFVTTKLPWHHPGREAESIDTSLKNFGGDYFDLWLMHFPQAIDATDEDFRQTDIDGVPRLKKDYTFTQTWAAMEDVYLNTKKVKAIGVSNFSIKNLEILLKTARVVPAVNQVEMHPYLAQNELVEYCRSKGILVTAYTPTGYATVRDDPVIVELAEKYKVVPAQIILAWHISRGVVAIPASKNEQHQKENINPPTLDAEDLARISALDKGQRICNKPDKNGLVWGWTAEQLGW